MMQTLTIKTLPFEEPIVKESTPTDVRKLPFRKVTLAVALGTALAATRIQGAIPVQSWSSRSESSVYRPIIASGALPFGKIAVNEMPLSDYNLIATGVIEGSLDTEMNQQDYQVIKDMIESSAKVTNAHIQRLDEKFDLFNVNLSNMNNILSELNRTLSDMNGRIDLLAHRVDLIQGSNTDNANRLFTWKTVWVTAAFSILGALVVAIGSPVFAKWL